MHIRGVRGGVRAAALALGLGGGAMTASAAAPAFLDALATVRVALPAPEPLENTRGRYTLSTPSGTFAVAEVRPGSPPVRARRLERTPGRVVLAGSFQSELGGDDWDPDGEVTQMAEIRPGVHELVVVLPRGRYEYKAARNGAWDENYGLDFTPGGANIALDVPRDGTVVRFVADFNARTLRDSVRQPSDVPAPSSAPPPPPDPPTGVRYDVLSLRLERPVSPSDVAGAMTLTMPDGARRPVAARDALSDPAFRYARDDLGARWTPQATTFKVWSPVSAAAEVLLFNGASGGTPRTVPMRRGAAGVWYVRVRGDLHGTYYRYRFHANGETREAADIASFAATADASRSMVVDLGRTNPPGWPGAALPARRAATDAVVYELQVRDLTILPSSGARPELRGTYPGLVQRGTRLPGGDFPTGLDFLANLGVTDIHLLPIHSSITVNRNTHGWGYATTLFNVPEEGYSTTPNDPENVIRETKQMVMGLHGAGLGVVLDVVYNHTWPPQGRDSAFEQTVPYYYFRTNDRGEMLNESGVGNALADERPMVRKFVRDSLAYWLTEYRVDGFRFDLLGMHAPESVSDWARALRRRRADVLIYGEPWTGGGPTRFGKGAQRGTTVAVFNDTFRGAIRGDTDGPGPGFSMGASVPADLLRLVLSGSPHAAGGFTDTPAETINYVSAHDNLTFWDKARRAMPGAGRDDLARAVKLAHAAVLLSQGVPFLEGGVEIGRTKGGDHNSYDAGDDVNAYHWEHAPAYRDVHAYIRGLIALRRALPALRQETAAGVRRAMRFLDAQRLPRGTVAYTMEGAPADQWKTVLVILHGAREPASMTLPAGEWAVLANAEQAGTSALGTASGALELAPLSAVVLAMPAGKR